MGKVAGQAQRGPQTVMRMIGLGGPRRLGAWGWADTLSWTVLSFAMAAAVLPFCWTLLNSFKLGRDIATLPPKLLFTPILSNYANVMAANIWMPLFNTALVTVGSVMLAVTVGSLGGYALARYTQGIFKVMGLFVFSMRFLPTIVFILPIFMMFSQLQLSGTRIGLVLAYQVFALPVTIWLTWGFFSQVPPELEEAAMIDGCSQFQSFMRISLPLALPGIGAAAAVTTIFSWNQFLVPFILGGRNAQVITTQIARYTGSEDAAAQWGELSALAVIIVLPVIIAGFGLNRYLLRGLLGRID